jgi:putative acetyltransferase
MFDIRPADPREDFFRGFLAASDALMASLYPAESNHMLGVETLRKSDIYFLGAWKDQSPVGCGAFRQCADYIEIKRVWVDPRARGLGLSRNIMQHLEMEAVGRGFKLARLETGIHQPEALGLYQSLGYAFCEPFGDYAADPLSVFMEKVLSADFARPKAV